MYLSFVILIPADSHMNSRDTQDVYGVHNIFPYTDVNLLVSISYLTLACLASGGERDGRCL
jgi:hypothetical protein